MGTKFTLIGSGLAGGLLAAYLGKRGSEVDLYERRADPRAGNFVRGRSINLALSTRGIHALQQLGIADEVMQHAIPMRGRMIHDKSGDLHFSPYDRDPSKCINSIGRAALNTTVIEAAQRYPNVRVMFNHLCTDVDLGRACRALAQHGDESDDHARGDAVIGVDGAFSAVRRAMQRLDRFDYSQSYLAHGYKELTIPPAADGVLADGKARTPHLAAEKFHDDRAAEPRWLFHLHALLGVRRAAQFRNDKDDDDVRRFFDEEFPDAVPLMPTLLEDFRRKSDRLARDCPLRAVALPRQGRARRRRRPCGRAVLRPGDERGIRGLRRA